MDKFIELNHGLIRVKDIIGVSDMFWSNVEIKPKNTKGKKNSLGPTKTKTKKGWGFSIFTVNNKISTYPTESYFNYNSNTRKYTLQKHIEFKSLLKSLCENE
jgi:hypothetical protein